MAAAGPPGVLTARRCAIFQHSCKDRARRGQSDDVRDEGHIAAQMAHGGPLHAVVMPSIAAVDVRRYPAEHRAAGRAAYDPCISLLTALWIAA